MGTRDPQEMSMYKIQPRTLRSQGASSTELRRDSFISNVSESDSSANDSQSNDGEEPTSAINHGLNVAQAGLTSLFSGVKSALTLTRRKAINPESKNLPKVKKNIRIGTPPKKPKKKSKKRRGYNQELNHERLVKFNLAPQIVTKGLTHAEKVCMDEIQGDQNDAIEAGENLTYEIDYEEDGQYTN